MRSQHGRRARARWRLESDDQVAEGRQGESGEMGMTALADHLEKGIAAARTGNKLLARLHLARATEADPDHDLGWLWLAWVAESPKVAQRLARARLQPGQSNRPRADGSSAG